MAEKFISTHEKCQNAPKPSKNKGGELNAAGGELKSTHGELKIEGGEINAAYGEVKIPKSEVNIPHGECKIPQGEVAADNHKFALGSMIATVGCFRVLVGWFFN